MKIIILLLVMVSFAISCTKKSELKVNLKIDNLVGDVFVGYQEAKTPIIKDTVKLSKEQEVVLDRAYQGIVSLIKAGENTPFISFMVDSTTEIVTITGDMESRSDIVVNGSTANDLMNQYTNLYPNKDTKETIKFIQENPNSIVSAYVLYRYLSPKSNVRELSEWLNILDKSLVNSTYIKELNRIINAIKSVSIGKVSTEVSLPNQNGEIIKLSSILKKNKYVLLDFWASWCQPCRNENKNLVKTYNKFKNKGFSIYAVSLDMPYGKTAWENAIEKDNLTWTNVSSLNGWNCPIAKTYAVRSLPTNYLIGSDGTIVGIDLKGSTLSSILGVLLK